MSQMYANFSLRALKLTMMHSQISKLFRFLNNPPGSVSTAAGARIETQQTPNAKLLEFTKTKLGLDYANCDHRESHNLLTSFFISILLLFAIL